MGGPGHRHDFRTVAKQGPRTQVEITVIPADSQLNDRDLEWSSYDASPRIYPFPENQITLWKEEKQWVAAVSKGSNLAYYHPLGVADLDEDVISELQCLYLTLEQKNHAAPLEGVTVWEQLLGLNTGAELESAFGVPVTCGTRPAPDFKRLGSSQLEPPAVSLQRQSESNRKRFLGIAAVVSLVYVALLTAAIFHLKALDTQNHATNRLLQTQAPQAEIVRNVLDRWETLRPAVDPSRYPLDLFHRCASILPNKGVRITHFEVKGDRLVIRGEATNPGLAINYQNKLISLKALSDFRWEARPPTIHPEDNRARFQAIGVYINGQAQN